MIIHLRLKLYVKGFFSDCLKTKPNFSIKAKDYINEHRKEIHLSHNYTKVFITLNETNKVFLILEPYFPLTLKGSLW